VGRIEMQISGASEVTRSSVTLADWRLYPTGVDGSRDLNVLIDGAEQWYKISDSEVRMNIL
jgi:hypothetical protein